MPINDPIGAYSNTRDKAGYGPPQLTHEQMRAIVASGKSVMVHTGNPFTSIRSTEAMLPSPLELAGSDETARSKVIEGMIAERAKIDAMIEEAQKEPPATADKPDLGSAADPNAPPAVQPSPFGAKAVNVDVAGMPTGK